MAKFLTFSRRFPKGHPRAGQPTYFVEKVLNTVGIDYESDFYTGLIHDINPGKEHLIEIFFNSLDYGIKHEKAHTIRSGYRWKESDKFSPRVWSGIPYRSSQIIFAPDIKLVKTYDFKIKKHSTLRYAEYINYHLISHTKLFDVAYNDGLSTDDFMKWFKWGEKEFSGQIICWKDPKYK